MNLFHDRKKYKEGENKTIMKCLCHKTHSRRYQTQSSRKNNKIHHRMTEGNQPAVTNMTIDKGNCIFFNLKNMDTTSRRIINSNKLNLSRLRVSPPER